MVVVRRRVDGYCYVILVVASLDLLESEAGQGDFSSPFDLILI